MNPHRRHASLTEIRGGLPSCSPAYEDLTKWSGFLLVIDTSANFPELNDLRLQSLITE